MFLGIYSGPLSSSGKLLLDATWRASGVKFDTNEHGYGSLSAFVQLPLHEAFQLYDKPGLPYVLLMDYGLTVFEGRLEDVSIQANGIQITAYGYWRALFDIPHTALWSTTQIDAWEGETTAQVASRTPVKWTFSTNDETLYIAPNKNENFANGTDAGAMAYQTPDGGTRTIIGMQFDYEFKAPVNWKARCNSIDRDFSASANQWLLNGNGAVQTGSINTTWTGQNRVEFTVVNETGGNVLKATDTGIDYLKITNLRAVTATTNRVNTTFTNNTVAGVAIVTPASMVNIYIGQRLIIASGNAGNSESVIVTAVTSTTFTATFVNNHAIGQTIRAMVVYADEIAKAIVTEINGTNSNQLSSSLTQIQSQSIDLFDELYEDQIPADILTYLVGLGDNQTTPRRWETGIRDNQSLYVQNQGYRSNTWYVDISDLSVERTLDTLYNSVYAVYKNANNDTVRTSATSDSASIVRYGLTRRTSIDVDTTSAIQAGIQQAMVLADKKEPPAKATIEFSKIYDSQGVVQPLWVAKAGDTVFIRNLPPDTSTTIDRIRSFRLSRTEYDVDVNVLTVEPEEPQDTLAFWLARNEKGIRTGANGSNSSGTVKR
jgi:hypothetical protein